jgi:hypothetical protein
LWPWLLQAESQTIIPIAIDVYDINRTVSSSCCAR